ncbi:bifunctional diguanylate cyclase/phosphodiesterase [Neptuniibacter halophilus]|uniref:bifunctional diguanylate cyclase/phosphodiesterase n=1 Tax=Neptuniibacter halophilus TaxID=651666 RepID=UPI00257400DD|nr:EAL domain-containing protein [Neptuniibacter halophilus]
MQIRTILLTLTLFCCLVAGLSVLFSYHQSQMTVLAREENNINTTAKLLAVELETALNNYRKVTSTMAAMSATLSVMAPENRTSQHHYAQAKALLNKFCINNMASLCYLMSPLGEVIVENRASPEQSLEGKNYAFRPYFSHSLKAEETVYAAFGITTRQRGIYFGHRITDQNNQTLGVAVVKVPMENFERSLAGLSGASLLLDPEGVIFAANRSEWVLSSLWPLSAQEQAEKKTNLQYAGLHIADLGFRFNPDRHYLLNNKEQAYYIGAAPLQNLPGWQVMHLQDPHQASPFSGSIIAVVSLLFLVACITSLLLFRVGMGDLKRRVTAEEELKNSEIRLRQLTELTSEGILIHHQGTIIDSNHAAEQIFGLSREELIDTDIWQLMAPESVATAVHNMQSGYERPYDIEGRRRDGEIFPMQICARDSLLRGKGIRVCCIRDLTQSQKQVTDRLSQAIHIAREDHHQLSILYIDLDNFKRFNDSWGHDFGDRLLTVITQKFRAALSDKDSLIRFGGDEFVVILQHVDQHNPALTRIEQLIRILNEDCLIDDRNISLSATFGIATYPEHGSTPKALLQNAELAMYRCREMGGQGFYAFYNNEMSAQAKYRLNLEQQLRHALEEDELSLHYQPVYSYLHQQPRLCAAEVLVRWHSKELGMVGPDQFIPIAESSGLIVEIGNWILREACHQGAIWAAQGHTDFRLAVNISPRQLQQKQFIDALKQILKESGFPPNRLCLEITEGMLIEDDLFAGQILSQIKASGVHLAIDDFGTGYSSLSYLKRYPFDYLKIDRSFVMDMEQDDSHQQLVKACILMAHGLSLKVIAEGVETSGQLHYLSQQRCDFYQGYLLSKPLARACFEAELENSQAQTALMAEAEHADLSAAL